MIVESFLNIHGPRGKIKNKPTSPAADFVALINRGIVEFCIFREVVSNLLIGRDNYHACDNLYLLRISTHKRKQFAVLFIEALTEKRMDLFASQFSSAGKVVSTSPTEDDNTELQQPSINYRKLDQQTPLSLARQRISINNVPSH